MGKLVEGIFWATRQLVEKVLNDPLQIVFNCQGLCTAIRMKIALYLQLVWRLRYKRVGILLQNLIVLYVIFHFSMHSTLLIKAESRFMNNAGHKLANVATMNTEFYITFRNLAVINDFSSFGLLICRRHH